MTAEAAVLNKAAVALAADSKASVRIENNLKTHDNANKLFALSKHHPIGVMINGSSEFMQVPWETILKVYRSRLRSRHLPSLKEHAEDFVLSLTVDLEHSEETQEDAVLSVVVDLLESVTDRAEELEFGRGSKQEEARRKAVETRSRILQQCDVLPTFEDITAEELLQRYRRSIERAVNARFEGWEEELKNKMMLAAAEALRRDHFSASASEVVVAGFGEQEIFPSLRSWNIDGLVADRLRVKLSHVSGISVQQTASIIPFAQREMVDRFMSGIDPFYRRYLERTYSQIMTAACSEVIEKYASLPPDKKEAAMADVTTLVSEKLSKHNETAGAYRKAKFSDPIMDMTALLPKEELAQLAESLVNLTSFKRRVSLDQESVGGPIDVAVISKGDGFVWIKRKHYFQPELNGMFKANYLCNHDTASGETANDRLARR